MFMSMAKMFGGRETYEYPNFVGTVVACSVWLSAYILNFGVESHEIRWRIGSIQSVGNDVIKLV